MDRREALRLLASAATLPLLPRDAFSLFRAVHEQLPASAALQTLNPHQNATVTTISELIIPQTDTPGATAARVNEFIDLVVTGWYDEEEKSLFLSGLAAVDARSRDLYGEDFIGCGVKQQVQVLTDLDEELSKVRGPVVPERPREAAATEKQFFKMMKHLTLVGYYTSEIGFVQELHQEIIPPRHAGCVPIEEAAGK